MPKRGIAATFSDQATHLTVTVFDGNGQMLCSHDNISSVTPAHAEDRFIDVFLPANVASLVPSPGINVCLIGINRSPCTSAGLGGYVSTSNKGHGRPGCAERLDDLVANGLTIGGVTYKFKLIVSVRNLYGGNSDAEASSSYAMEYYASQHGDALQFEFQRTATGSRFSGTAAAKKKSRIDF